MSADPILTPEQVRAERNIADGAAGWRVPIQKLCDSHESLRARAAELESAIARLYVVACPGWASDGTATNMLANIERRAAELEATIARLSEQSRAISVLLSDAGVNAMPIVEGVRTLVSRLDMTRGQTAVRGEHDALETFVVVGA